MMTSSDCEPIVPPASAIRYSGRGRNRPDQSLPQKIIVPRQKEVVVRDCKEILALFDNLAAIDSYSDRRTANLIFGRLDYCAAILAKSDQLILELDALVSGNLFLRLLLTRKINKLRENRTSFYAVYQDVWALRVAEDM